MATPREVIAANRAKREATGLPSLSGINRKPPITLVVNPEYTRHLSEEASGYALPSIDCMRCEADIALEQRPFTWTIGQLKFQFNDIPYYR